MNIDQIFKAILTNGAERRLTITAGRSSGPFVDIEAASFGTSLSTAVLPADLEKPGAIEAEAERICRRLFLDDFFAPSCDCDAPPAVLSMGIDLGREMPMETFCWPELIQYTINGKTRYFQLLPESYQPPKEEPECPG